MKAVFGGLLGAVALVSLACLPVVAQETPAAPLPAHKTHHTSHHRRKPRLNADQSASLASQPQPPDSAHPGTEPAPVPNEDMIRPNRPLPSEGEVAPGAMSIHYPPTGEGYLPGSSSSDMDNRTTPSVPGVQYQEPLTNPAPQSLPPPRDGN